jgi:hypothetical protein
MPENSKSHLFTDVIELSENATLDTWARKVGMGTKPIALISLNRPFPSSVTNPIRVPRI